MGREQWSLLLYQRFSSVLWEYTTQKAPRSYISGDFFQSRCFISVVPRLLKTLPNFFPSVIIIARGVLIFYSCPPMTPALAQEMHRNSVWFLYIAMWLQMKVASTELCRNCRIDFHFPPCYFPAKLSDCFQAA